MRRVTIKPNETSLGHVRFPRRRTDPDALYDWRAERWAEIEIRCSLAGPQTERRFRGRLNRIGAAGDYRDASDVAFWAMGSGEMASAYLTFLGRLVRNQVAGEPLWLEVEAVAAALLEGETLTGQEVRDVLMAAADERFGKVEIRTPRMVIGKSSRNVGYAWSRAHVPDHPDVVATARIIRDVMSTVRREMAGDTYHDCLFLGGDPVADSAQDALAIIIDAIDSHGAYSLH